MLKSERRAFAEPDEVRTFPNGRAEILAMDGGTEYFAVAGDVTSLPSGHDAWVVGDEDVVVVDWFGASHYAQQQESLT